MEAEFLLTSKCGDAAKGLLPFANGRVLDPKAGSVPALLVERSTHESLGFRESLPARSLGRAVLL